jgi:hypothetical protein
MRAMRQYRLFSWMILKPFVAADVLAVVDRYRCTPATLAARIGYSGSRFARDSSAASCAK